MSEKSSETGRKVFKLTGKVEDGSSERKVKERRKKRVSILLGELTNEEKKAERNSQPGILLSHETGILSHPEESLSRKRSLIGLLDTVAPPHEGCGGEEVESQREEQGDGPTRRRIQLSVRLTK